MKKELGLVRFVFEQHQRLNCLIRFSNVPRLASQSVAEHSYSTTFLALVVADYLALKDVKVDKLRMLEMGLVHDVEEVISGDILKTLKHGGFKKELDKMNLQNMDYLLRMLPPPMELYYLAVWDEAKQRETLEARLLSFVDMLDRILYSLRETHLGNNYFREIVAFETKKLLEWKKQIPELGDLVDTIYKYVGDYLKGDKKRLNEISRAVRVYDYKI